MLGSVPAQMTLEPWNGLVYRDGDWWAERPAKVDERSITTTDGPNARLP
jgi:hypothetical protein